MFGGPAPNWHGNGSHARTDPFAAFLQRAAGINIDAGISQAFPSVVNPYLHRPSIVNCKILKSAFHTRRDSILLRKGRVSQRDEQVLRQEQYGTSHLFAISVEISFVCVTESKNIQLVVSLVSLDSKYSTEICSEFLAQPDEYSRTVDLTRALEEMAREETHNDSSGMPVSQSSNEQSPNADGGKTSDDTDTLSRSFIVKIILKEKPTLVMKKDKLMREETVVQVKRDDQVRVELVKQTLFANLAHLQKKRRDAKSRKLIIGDLYQNSNSSDGAVYYTSNTANVSTGGADTSTVSAETRVDIPMDDADRSSQDDIHNPCVICMSEPSTCACVPCRHLCMCHECSKELTIQANAPDKCPMCRAIIDVIVNLDENAPSPHNHEGSVSIPIPQ